MLLSDSFEFSSCFCLLGVTGLRDPDGVAWGGWLEVLGALLNELVSGGTSRLIGLGTTSGGTSLRVGLPGVDCNGLTVAMST